MIAFGVQSSTRNVGSLSHTVLPSDEESQYRERLRDESPEGNRAIL